ncbi:MAG: ribosome biogenesis GTPase Der [Candidatus Marinimicrobia bacterium]|jgi:GTP-binding protein|nr:ribosome biogenesis GTPase Der [Candidatus Neomarinimicrobiota bacterium]MBT3502437.1 ribosome biogenesis GTPase Der [Candidatus Neomarinimicrobiota bacterium]MBT3838765.1 ribosome biogenesis GTPase Der [Candidatus Neomarinimicrobiota bacterium]MBT3999661.1 ribosome biogenesis GTPase Der [Candidatus Neomarinimicrobiota bacterium]MBT4578774.1 ribosome biogenesis GTPase Der [Candidatus Neomarinimicrobiota bacterium]
MVKPIIAIVGRPNVGKSTFFNRVLSQRQAIVDAQEGITRDRIYGDMEWCAHPLKFVDTGGYIPDDFDIFNAAVREQAQQAMAESDLVLFMVDGKQGITASDQALAQFVRESGKPYILAVNKCDGYKTDNLIHQFHEFGLDSIMPISALNGRQIGDLLDTILSKLNLTEPPTETDDDEGLRLAIVGMPNVGKSSLTNALLQKERTIVTPIAGTTRDAIDAHIKWHGEDVTLVDTAGLRKLAKIKDKIEYYSTVRTQNAIHSANVVLVLIDAEKGFGKQDKSIVDFVMDKGKGLIFVVNKWDLIQKETYTMKNFEDEIRYQFKALDHYPLLFISAITKQRIHKVLETAWEVYKRSQDLVSTKKLNDALDKIITKNPPSAEQGRLIRIKYATQVSRSPSVIALYSNHPKAVKTSYKRYIENQLRLYFNFNGIPFKLSFRKK